MTYIYVIYNADSSLMGKMKYACAKIMSSSSSAPCPACDLTHNGLHLTESAQWSMTKKRIEGAEVQQLHRDQLGTELREFIDVTKLELPVILGQESPKGALKLLMNRTELDLCSKDHERFLENLHRNATEQSFALKIRSKV